MTPGADSYKRLDGEEKGVESKSSSTLDRKSSRTEKIPKSASRELGHNAGEMWTDGTVTGLRIWEDFFYFSCSRKFRLMEQ